MKRFFKRFLGLVIGLLLLVGLWLVAGVWWPLTVPQPNQQLAQLLLEDVELIDVESGLLRSGQDILIEAGQIVAVGPDLQAPGAERIAGDGLFAIPGLFDMHMHSTSEAIAAGQRSIEHAFLFIWDCYPEMDDLRQAQDPRQLFTNELRKAMITGHDAGLCSQLHRQMSTAGTAYVPTHTTRKLDAYATDEAFRTDPRLRYIPGPLRRLWLSDADGMARRAGDGGQQSYMDFYRFGIQQTGIAHRAGVTVLAGSDAPDSFAFPGSAIHDELDHLVEAGLSPLDALRSATIEPARFLDLEGQAGVIRPGAVRDIETVILAGAVYDREDLENLLAGVESAAGSWAMWPRFTWQILNSPIMKKQFGD